MTTHHGGHTQAALAPGGPGWREFLERWNTEWLAVTAPEDRERALPEGGSRLGYAPAGADRIAALEQRIGLPLPPSFRGFLEVSDGWREAGCFISRLSGADGVEWYGDPYDQAEGWADLLPEEPSERDLLEHGMWGRSWQLALESDATEVLLDPGDPGPDGEWPVYVWASWRDGPERHASFGRFMEEMYREFHRIRVAASGVETETTRRLDASVAEAVRRARAGEVDGPLAALREANAYGRPGAGPACQQLEGLLAGRPGYDSHSAGTGPRGLALAAVSYFEGRPGASPQDAAFLMRGLAESEREQGLAVLASVAEGTYVHEEPGAFGAALEEARALAARGRTRRAWRVLLAAVPAWIPEEPYDVAPAGLLADSLLCALLDGERGRALLSTPRGGLPVSRAPGPDTEHDDLDWLSERGNQNLRLVLAEGVPVEELGRRLLEPGPPGAPRTEGYDEDEVPPAPREPGPPTTPRVARTLRHTYQSPVFRLGECANGWSFASEENPTGSPLTDPDDYGDLPAALSVGARALVIWSDGHRQGYVVRHFVDGAETYALGSRPVLGEDPAALDVRGDIPEGLAADPDLPAVLAALSRLYGVGLPEDALVRGRLPVVVSRSWRRPPRAGEYRAVVRFVSASAVHRRPAGEADG
ncbi:SMI1/KNR4 family protein [Streptomyces sp. NPDC049954]|uniref:SMI1/KNR4 family protein n=1 Tax=Streptomyces sp. NPDC049954 TaxID=3155779 RepID=UPI00343D8DC7